MTDFIPSPMLHRQFGSPFDRPSRDISSCKRSRPMYDEFEERSLQEEEITQFNGNETTVETDFGSDYHPEKRIRRSSYQVNGPEGDDERDQNDCHQEKRLRTSVFTQPNFSSHNGFLFNDSGTTIQRLEKELRNERQEVQMKEEQLHMANAENKSISDQLEVLEARSSRLKEENTILKKAVNIQESRMKDLSQQNIQLQEFLTRAVERIAQLESVVGTKFQADDIESIIGHQRPPDVC